MNPGCALVIRRLVAGLLLLLVTGCGLNNPTASSQNTSIVGVRWVLTSLQSNSGTLSIPADVSATLELSPKGKIGMDDGVNFTYGNYEQSGNSFHVVPGSYATSAVGYIGTDPGQLAAIDLVSRIATTPAGDITTAVTGDQLTLKFAQITAIYREDDPSADHLDDTPQETTSG